MRNNFELAIHIDNTQMQAFLDGMSIKTIIARDDIKDLSKFNEQQDQIRLER